MSSGSLYTATLRLVRNRPVHMTYDKITQACSNRPGNKVTADWLRQFATGRSRSPDVDRVQAVYECLSDTTLLKSN